MKIRKKLSERRGFTLAEALVAIIILLLVSSIVAAGVPAAATALDKAVTASNAQVLLSTAIGQLRAELGTARDIRVEEDKRIRYYSADTRSDSMIFLDDDDEIVLQEYLAYDGDDGYTDDVSADNISKTLRKLVTEKAGTDPLYVTFTKVSYDPDDNIVTFEGLAVYRKSGSAAPLANLGDPDILTIRVTD